MKSFRIKQGHNISIDGDPKKILKKIPSPKSIVLHPSSIENIKAKLLIKEGDDVKIGTPLFYDKKNKESYFVSSCSGKVKKIIFGNKRIIERIEISNTGNEHIDIDNNISIGSLLKSGLWNCFRQKPFSKIPKFDELPKEIYISTMPSEPFAIDYKFLFSEIDNYLQKGIDALNSLFNCKINISSDVNCNVFNSLNHVSHYSFNKLHPSGNVGVQIHHINPIINASDKRWYLSLQDLNRIGEFFSKGYIPNRKYINAGGNGLNIHCMYNVQIGTIVSDFIDLNVDESRIISGDILNGKELNYDNSINIFDEIVSVIKIDNKREFLGWMSPGLNKYSISKTFLSKLNNNKKSILSTKLNGSIRTIIPMGNWDKVLPMNILSEYLIKNILAGDIEMMEKLGIYECSPEDFSLCSFACQSKVEVSKIIQKGLDLMESEE